MAKKEKVNLRRTEDFDEVDHELAEAMAMLDEANARVNHVLEGGEEDGETVPGASTEDEAAAQAGAAEGTSEEETHRGQAGTDVAPEE
ncbi:MAG: hypothetical protein ACLFTT_15780 [Candidatus Hydrogenedentota bacterium]